MLLELTPLASRCFELGIEPLIPNGLTLVQRRSKRVDRFIVQTGDKQVSISLLPRRGAIAQCAVRFMRR